MLWNHLNYTILSGERCSINKHKTQYDTENKTKNKPFHNTFAFFFSMPWLYGRRFLFSYFTSCFSLGVTDKQKKSEKCFHSSMISVYGWRASNFAGSLCFAHIDEVFNTWFFFYLAENDDSMNGIVSHSYLYKLKFIVMPNSQKKNRNVYQFVCFIWSNSLFVCYLLLNCDNYRLNYVNFRMIYFQRVFFPNLMRKTIFTTVNFPPIEVQCAINDKVKLKLLITQADDNTKIKWFIVILSAHWFLDVI